MKAKKNGVRAKSPRAVWSYAMEEARLDGAHDTMTRRSKPEPQQDSETPAARGECDGLKRANRPISSNAQVLSGEEHYARE